MPERYPALPHCQRQYGSKCPNATPRYMRPLLTWLQPSSLVDAEPLAVSHFDISNRIFETRESEAQPILPGDGTGQQMDCPASLITPSSLGTSLLVPHEYR